MPGNVKAGKAWEGYVYNQIQFGAKTAHTVLSHLHRESQSQIYYNIWKSCPLSKHGEATVQCVNTQLQDPLKFNEYKQMTYLDKHLALLSHQQAQLYLEYLILPT